MSKGTKPQKRFFVVLRPTKKNPNYSDANVYATRMFVNGRGDLEFTEGGISGYCETSIVAAFATGSWLSAVEIKDA